MIAQQLLNGLFLGAVYALFAVGYTLVFGVLDILNLAHAAIFTAAAFAAFSLAAAGVPLPLAFLAAAVLAGIMGILLDRVAFAPLRARNAGTLVPLISSIGVAIIIGAILRGIYGVDERHFTVGGLDTAPVIRLGPLTFTTVELTIFLAAIALMLVLSWILRATTLGRRIRAVAEDRVAAALLGVDLERTIAATFFIASSLGGAAGILTGLEYNSHRHGRPDRAQRAGRDHPRWDGQRHRRGDRRLHPGRGRDARDRLRALCLARRRPLRRDVRPARRAPDRTVREARAAHSVGAAVSVLLDFYAKHSRLIDQIGVNAILALSLSVSLQAGQLALAQAAFMGIAAYISTILAVNAHWPLFATIAVAVLASTIVAALLAYPVRRLRGVFLAIATIGFGEIVRVVANNLKITGGAEGISSIPNDATTPVIYGALALVGLALFALSRTKFALAVALVREDEYAARGVGVDVGMIRTLSLALGGAIAGLGGALYAHASFFITPTDFGFGRMEQILVWCVVGGVTSPLGALLGATVLSILPEAIRFLADYREITNGIILLAVILFAPGGLSSLWRRGTIRVRV